MLNESIISKNKKYVIGVSGGPDSMALLDMLRKLEYQLIVCLVNYHKRSDSDLDYEVVQAYCTKYHIPLAYKEIFQYEKGNFQAQAREMRYQFYEEIASLYQCNAVLLAHHKDDYLETVLMQKERNQTDGLWGIQEMSKYKDLVVLRPVLDMTKNELLTYCHTYQIEYRIDSSNLESDYTRNYFRNHVLKYYDDDMKKDLFNEAKQHNATYMEIENTCREWINKNVENNTFSFNKFLEAKYPSQLLKMYLLTIEGMDPSRISHTLIENCLNAISNKTGNVKINLPFGFVLVKEYDNIYVTKLNNVEKYSFVITDRECKDYGYFKITHEGHDRCGITLKDDDFPLIIRTYENGDYMELSYGKKKLSRLFIDAKIPQHLREVWPVVVNCKGEIILVPKIGKKKDYLLAKPTWFVIQ